MLCLAALAFALSAGAPAATDPTAAMSRLALDRAGNVSLHARAAPSRRLAALALVAPDRPEAKSPPCPGYDVCQPAFVVPGYEPRPVRGSRTEMVALALQRSNVEPLASIASALVSTGLRVEYMPVVQSGPNATGGHGWGSVMLRLRLRVDAMNKPVFPKRS